MRVTVERANRILSILKRETDAKQRLTAPALAERLRKEGIPAERRSVYRAVSALQQQGEPIASTQRGYYYMHPAADEDFVFSLAAAVSSASFLTEERKGTLLSSLAARLEKEEAALLLSRAETLSGDGPKDDTLFLSLSALAKAIDRKRQVSFYLPGSHERCRVSPYGIVLSGGIWKLLFAFAQEKSLSAVPVVNLRGLRTEVHPRRHAAEVSPYKGRFDVADALRRFFPKQRK